MRKITAALLALVVAAALAGCMDDNDSADERLSASAVSDSGILSPSDFSYSDEFTKYENADEKISDLIGMGYDAYLYDFRKDMRVGYALSYGNDPLPVEADYGLSGTISQNCAAVKFYNNSALPITAESISFGSADKNSSFGGFSAGTAEAEFDLSGLDSGLYRVSAAIRQNGELSSDPNSDAAVNTEISMYIYINNGADFCEILFANDSTFGLIKNRRTNVLRLISDAGVTPENSSDAFEIFYPYRDNFDGAGNQIWRCDTEKWAELSDSLVEEEWSEERKAFVICRWISENIAYDDWKTDRQDRDYLAGDYMGDYSVWKLRAGVCRDIGQIAAIMLRKQRIPCGVISFPDHLWNFVYLNGNWLELDLVQYVQYRVATEDVTLREPAGNNYSGMLNIVPQSVGSLKNAAVNEKLYTESYR